MYAWLKKQFTLFSLCMLLLCLFLFYGWIDARVTIDHSMQTYDYHQIRINLLKDILEVTSLELSRTELTQLLKKRFKKDNLIEETEDTFEVDDIIFTFKGESLVGISFYGETFG